MSIKVDSSKNGKTYRCVITDANGEELISQEVTIHVVVPAASSVPSVNTVEEPVTTEPETYNPVT